MSKTFKRKITFLSQTIKEGDEGWNEVPVTKEVTFKELNRTDRDQHKLHFSLISIFKSRGDSFNIDSEALYDLVVRFIDTMVVLDDKQFTIQDKEELLNDSGALLDFGLWLMPNKITPFFSNLIPKSKK
jgi:hypothetical protein